MIFGRWIVGLTMGCVVILLAPEILCSAQTGAEDATPRLAKKMPVADYVPDEPSTSADEPDVQWGQYWSFPNEEGASVSDHAPQLIPLPPVEKVASAELFQDAIPESDRHSAWGMEIGRLLPPQPLSDLIVLLPPVEKPLHVARNNPSQPYIRPLPTQQSAAGLPLMQELSTEEQELARQLRDATSAATGVLTDARVDQLAKKKIQHAYAMANRSAYYVARQELIEVLRLISEAKDAQIGTPERTVALAIGLRALSEADDFEPRGAQLEAEVDVVMLCASHRTPVAKQLQTDNLLPRILQDRYLRYAQLQLAKSVAGEPAGSMALHALGKLAAQLGRAEPEKYRLAERHAIAYQQAALLAHDQNYLAAHELGVLLASAGHVAEAEQLLRQVAIRAPNSIVYRNLAIVQQELGQLVQAESNRQYAQQLAQQGATGTHNVQWVSAEKFAQTKSQPARYSVARTPTSKSQSPTVHHFAPANGTNADSHQPRMPTSQGNPTDMTQRLANVLTIAALVFLCQTVGVVCAQPVACLCADPAAPHPIWAVDSISACGKGEVGWKHRSYCVDWQAYAQGEYVGHARTAHVHEYRLRVDDRIAFTFRLTREESSRPYELQVGDTIRVESLTGDSNQPAGDSSSAQNDSIGRELVVQPDGSISLPLLGQVRARADGRLTDYASIWKNATQNSTAFQRSLSHRFASTPSSTTCSLRLTRGRESAACRSK